MLKVPVMILEQEANRTTDWCDRVRDRAYELFVLRGEEPGHEREDWLQAEQEVLNGPEYQVMETAEGYRLRCRLPGFEAGQISVRAGEYEVVVEAQRKELERELELREVFGRMNVDTKMDVHEVTATFDGGTLEVNVPVRVEQPKAADRVLMAAAQ
ncbi:MAG: DUF2934 domain-containing protein [Acidobacteriota bacterium]